MEKIVFHCIHVISLTNTVNTASHKITLFNADTKTRIIFRTVGRQWPGGPDLTRLRESFPKTHSFHSTREGLLPIITKKRRFEHCTKYWWNCNSKKEIAINPKRNPTSGRWIELHTSTHTVALCFEWRAAEPPSTLCVSSLWRCIHT